MTGRPPDGAARRLFIGTTQPTHSFPVVVRVRVNCRTRVPPPLWNDAG